MVTSVNQLHLIASISNIIESVHMITFSSLNDIFIDLHPEYSLAPEVTDLYIESEWFYL